MGNRRIHLLFIVNSLQFGGAEKHVVTLLNRLDVARFQLSLVYLKHQETLLQQIDLARLEGRVSCAHVAGKVDLRAVRDLATQIDGDAIDIVVCTNTYSLLYGWLARIRSRHHPRLVEVFHSTDLGTLKDKLQMQIYRPLFFACDMLVYVCESQRGFWRARALRARREAVIHNGVDIERFVDRFAPEETARLRQAHGFSAADYVVGLCAVMRPEKAHADLLQAVMRLRVSGIDIKCLFIGDGPERPAIEAQIRAMGLEGHVRITGFMADVRPAIAACDAMALVSHHVETFSIAALEAMALGKPMVMSRVGGAVEQVTPGDNGYLFERGDIGALADALYRLSDREHCRRMSARARETVVRRFSLAAMIAAYDRLFCEIAQAPGAMVEARHGG